MAYFSINVTGEAIAASTVETILQVVASANKRVKVVRWGVSFNGADATKSPVRVELIRLTSAGTSSAYTPKKINEGSDAPMAAGRTAHTAEPTAGDVLEVHYITPAGGNLIETYTLDEAPVVAASGRLGIRVLSSDAWNVNAFLIFEE